jgi:integral membrane protein
VFFVRWYRRYQQFRPFTDEEAWMLYRLAAFSEAVGWTLLIIGIACKELPVWWNQIPVGIAGRVHGVLFLIYFVAVLLLAPSMGWSWKRIFFACLFGNPPYGSLVFEKWAEQDRKWSDLKGLRSITRYQEMLHIVRS